MLTHRIAYLVATDAAKPNEILAITFTNKAAGEMRDRAELLVGRRVRAMWVMTFHAACARMLRAEAARLGYTRQFTIYDTADSRRLIKRCLDDLGIDPKRFTPGSVDAQISDAKNKLRDADAYAQMVGSFFEQTVADVYRSYERELHRMNAMDFDDLLVRAVNVLELFPEVRERYATASATSSSTSTRTPTTPSTAGSQLLAGEHRNLMVVGRRCPVPGRGHARHDGGRHAAADRDDPSPGTRCCRPTAAGSSAPPRSSASTARAPRRHRDHHAVGAADRQHPEHTHFAGHPQQTVASPGSWEILPVRQGASPTIARVAVRGAQHGRSANARGQLCRSLWSAAL